MLPKNTKIFASFSPESGSLVLPILEQVKKEGWKSIDTADFQQDRKAILQTIERSDIVLIFLCKEYAQDEVLMLEEFAYAATVARKPYYPIWLDSLESIQSEYLNADSDKQFLSTLEMLTAKHTVIANTAELISRFEQYKPDDRQYTPTKPHICEKPCEAYEGEEPYLFISYAHDNAEIVYPVIKKLYESGWDLWYDEGIKITERYLPVIAHNLKRSAVFVLMLTNRCLERPFVIDFELEYARQLGIPIIPVLLEDIKPEPWSKETANLLLKTAVSPNMLNEHVEKTGLLTNRGNREAVPPAVRNNVIYDVVLPPQLPGFEYSSQGGEITLTKYVGEDTDVIIPGAVSSDGSMEFKVTVIGEKLFKHNNKLNSVTISENIAVIGNSAFQGCSSLKHISLPNSLESFGMYAFDECRELVSIEIPDNVVVIGGFAFTNCSSLKHIDLPNGLKGIQMFAFANCIELVSITIPDSVVAIHENAFKGCTSLNIIFPEGKSSDTLMMSEDAWNDFFSRKNDLLVVGEGDDRKDMPLLPQCEESPYALVCCAENDVNHVTTLLTELYWEGFNVFYSDTFDFQKIEESSCILAFFSEHTEKSNKTMELLKYIVEHDTSKIIQIFIGDCFKLPDEIQLKLQDRQAIIAGSRSAQEFTGLIRESLRDFGCSLNIPRGFDIKEIEGGIEIAKFHPTDFPKVIIPKTFSFPPLPVTAIGDSAFIFCNSLTSIALPDSVISIGRQAFSYCKSITSMFIPKSVTSIGDEAFLFCESLIEIKADEENPSYTGIEGVLFNKDKTILILYPGAKADVSYEIPNTVRTISSNAFTGNKHLINITIPESVLSIGEHSFSGCHNLKSIIIPKSVNSIGFDAFSGCKALREICVNEDNPSHASVEAVLLNKSKTMIMRYPEGKPNTSYEIPEGVTSISDGAIYDNEYLESVTMPDGVTDIGKNAFSLCNNLTSITIPDSVISIGEYAFSGCESLTSFTIPKGITGISNSTFQQSTNLVNIVIPDGVTDIGESAFWGCDSLTSITIPDSVTGIGEDAFDYCDQLTIRCSENSTAHRYAKNHRINFEFIS